MNSKLLVIDNCSKLEAELSGDIPIDNVALADSVVNPTWNNLVGKTIIINLPTDIDLKRLCRYNRVISRFPLIAKDGTDLKYELVPFEAVEFKFVDGERTYDKRILNKYLMRSSDETITSNDRFLLGTDIEVDGHLTSIGYIIVKTIKQ